MAILKTIKILTKSCNSHCNNSLVKLYKCKIEVRIWLNSDLKTLKTNKNMNSTIIKETTAVQQTGRILNDKTNRQ